MIQHIGNSWLPCVRAGALIGLLAAVEPMMAQTGSTATDTTRQGTSPATRATPPTRDPHTSGFVSARELPDGATPAAEADGNFIIGPTHTPGVEMIVHDGVPHGTVHTFTLSSADSRIFPGIARDSGTFGAVSRRIP